MIRLRSSGRDVLRLGAVVLLTAVVFSPVVRFDFLNYDDDVYVTSNPQVRAGLTLAGVAWAFTNVGYASNWHPITWISHMLDVQLFGLNAGPHHLVNLLLHLANAALVLLLLQKLTGAVWRSTLAAALFAVHPLHVESVAWIAERKDVLSSLFGLLALFAYQRYIRRPGTMRYLPVALFLALGLAAKPMLVALPLVFLILDYWPLGRFRSRRTALRLLAEKAPLFLLAAGCAFITYQAQGGAIALRGTAHLGIRLANTVGSYAGYLKKMIWPLDLSVHYPIRAETFASGTVIAAAILLFAISAVALLRARRAPALAAGWLWYLCTLLPVIGLIQASLQAMADRYTYLPLLGPFVMIAWGIPELLPECWQRAKVLRVAAALCVGLLSVRAFDQVLLWRNSVTLFSHAIEVAPKSFVAWNNLGSAYFNQGRRLEAIPFFQEAVRLAPFDIWALFNLGKALTMENRYAEAIPPLERAWGHALARGKGLFIEKIAFLLGEALLVEGRTAEAAERMQVGLMYNPRQADMHINLGLALDRLGRHGEAVAHFEEALRLSPGNPRLKGNLPARNPWK